MKKILGLSLILFENQIITTQNILTLQHHPHSL